MKREAEKSVIYGDRQEERQREVETDGRTQIERGTDRD